MSAGASGTIENALSINLTPDGGVKKQILTPAPAGAVIGITEVTPIAVVEYEGKLEDGHIFDTCQIDGRTYEFQTGRGQVIRGFDLGVLSMKIGEKALFTIRGDYGYGDKGSGDDVPPNATLLFEVTLLEVKTSKEETRGLEVDTILLGQLKLERSAGAQAKADATAKRDAAKKAAEERFANKGAGPKGKGGGGGGGKPKK